MNLNELNIGIQSIEPTNNGSGHADSANDEYSFSEEELQSIIKVFSLLKNQRDKIANNNLDTQVDTFELEKILKHN